MKRHFSDGSIPTLEVALTRDISADDLKKLASHTNQKIPTRKADIATVIMQHLEGERLQAVWQGLDELQRAAVAEVVHSISTRFPADRFAARYGHSPDWGTVDKYGYRQKPSALALFFYGGVMPDDLKARLKAFVPKPAAAKIKTLRELPAAYDLPRSGWDSKTRETGTDGVPLTVHQTELTAQRELLAVLRLVDSGKVSVSNKTRRPSAVTIRAITDILEGGDYYPALPARSKWPDEHAGPIRAFAWPLIVQAGGLVQLAGSKLQLTRAGRNALSRPASETLRKLWLKWIDTTIVDELRRIECIKGQTGKGKRGLTALSSRRGAIVDTLAECPVGSWISVNELRRFVCASGKDFSVARNAWDLYICELIECGDPALAARIANDSRTRKHCMLAGERHLAVPPASEAAFKRTLREVGYLVAMAEVKTAKPGRKAAVKKPAVAEEASELNKEAG